MNKYNDFSSLKSLRKALKKGEAASSQELGGKRNARESKSSGAAGKADNAHGLRPGCTVTLMDSNDRGIVRQVLKDGAEIEMDGLTFKLGFDEFIVNDPAEDARLMESIGKSRPQKEISSGRKASASADELSVDLHIGKIPGGTDAPEGFELAFQLDYFRRILLKNLKHRGKRISFIHGVGDGILRDALRKEIDEAFAVSCTWTPGPPGVTIVCIR